MMGGGMNGMMWAMDILGLLLLAALVLGIAALVKYLVARKWGPSCARSAR